MASMNPVATRRDGTDYLVYAAAAILLITMGARQTLGLFVRPLNAATGLGIVAISFALAIGQFVWGLAQPFFGAIADRFGSGPVLVAGAGSISSVPLRLPSTFRCRELR